MGIKLINGLPLQLKQLHNDFKYFKSALKDFLYCHSFYTLEEYLDYGKKKDMATSHRRSWYIVLFQLLLTGF
jgi:hypothetical protein